MTGRRHPRAAERDDPVRLGTGRRERQRHRADQRRAATSAWSRAASSNFPALRWKPCTTPAARSTSTWMRSSSRPRTGIGFIGLGFKPKWKRDEIPWMPKGRYKIMRDYMPKRRHARPRHDDAHLHRAGQPRLRLRSRHGEEVPRRAGAAADRHGAVRRFALHRRQAQRLPELPLAYLDRHRSRPHRHAAVRVRGRLRLRALCRLRARRADVLRLPRRQIHRCLRPELPRLPSTASCRPAGRAADDDATGPTT